MAERERKITMIYDVKDKEKRNKTHDQASLLHWVMYISKVDQMLVSNGDLVEPVLPWLGAGVQLLYN